MVHTQPVSLSTIHCTFFSPHLTSLFTTFIQLSYNSLCNIRNLLKSLLCLNKWLCNNISSLGHTSTFLSQQRLSSEIMSGVNKKSVLLFSFLNIYCLVVPFEIHTWHMSISCETCFIFFLFIYTVFPKMHFCCIFFSLSHYFFTLLSYTFSDSNLILYVYTPPLLHITSLHMLRDKAFLFMRHLLWIIEHTTLSSFSLSSFLVSSFLCHSLPPLSKFRNIYTLLCE